MEVTVIGKLAGTSPGVKTKQNTDSSTDFSSVLGQILNTGSQSDAPRKAQTADDEKGASNTGGKKSRGNTDKDSDAAQPADSPSAGAQALAGAEQSAAQAAAAATQNAVSAAVPAEQSAQPAATVPDASAAAVPTMTTSLPTETLTKPTPVLTTETFTANVKAALEKSADALQAQQTPQVDQTPQTQTVPLQTEPIKQAAQTEQTAQPILQETVSVQTAAQTEIAEPAAKTETPAAPKPDAASKQETQTAEPVVQQPAQPAAQNADMSGQSGENGAAQAEETVQPQRTETKKTDASKTAAPQFSAAMNTHAAAQTQETADMQTAVNQALDRFDQDFQGMSADTRNLQISLHPKELGTVSISLAAGAAGVTAKIQTSSAEAASLLSAQVQRMIESMEAKGVRVQNVEVVLTQTPQQNTGDGGRNGAQQYQAQNTRLYAQQSNPVEKGSALSDYERMTETYSAPSDEPQRVEYRV